MGRSVHAFSLPVLPRVVYKRGSISPYLDETAFRYNSRENPYLFRDTLTALLGADALPYEKLTS